MWVIARTGSNIHSRSLSLSLIPEAITFAQIALGSKKTDALGLEWPKGKNAIQ